MKSKFQIPDAINCSVDKDFTQIPNDILRNPEISGKGKAILCLLLSNREGWKSHLTTIGRMMKEGDDALRSGIEELEEFGYLARLKYRNKKDKKWIGALWAYTDTPYAFDIQSQLNKLYRLGLEIPALKPIKPQPENPDVGNPDVGNPGLIIHTIKKTNEYTLSNSTSKREKTISPKDFPNFWKLWPAPRRGSKGKALIKWEKVCRSDDAPPWQRVRQAILRQIKSEQWKEVEFIPFAWTWLHNKRWLDDPSQLKLYNYDDEKQDYEQKPKDDKWME